MDIPGLENVRPGRKRTGQFNINWVGNPTRKATAQSKRETPHTMAHANPCARHMCNQTLAAACEEHWMPCPRA